MIKLIKKYWKYIKPVLFVGASILAYLALEWIGVMIVFIVDAGIALWVRRETWGKYPHDKFLSNLMSAMGCLFSVVLQVVPGLWCVEVILFILFWIVVYILKYTVLLEYWNGK